MKLLPVTSTVSKTKNIYEVLFIMLVTQILTCDISTALNAPGRIIFSAVTSLLSLAIINTVSSLLVLFHNNIAYTIKSIIRHYSDVTSTQ